MKFSLTGKTAIVTGGGSGIGEAIVKSLAEAGAQVKILDLSLENAMKVANEAAGSVEAFACDVGKQSEVAEVISKAITGQIDILVNNAGIAHIGSVETTSEADLDKLYAVNIKGVFNGIKVAIPFMKEQGGVIINIASIASHIGLKDRFAYTMTKGAVYSMSMSVAKDYLAYGIRCNTISPARIHTPFVDGFIRDKFPGKEKEMFEALSNSQPVGRMGRPEEVGDLVLYLCSDEAAFITGSDFPIDGGFVTLNN